MTVEPRLFLNTPLTQDQSVELDKDQAHYLLTVMRRKRGDGVRVFNGQDGEWRAIVSETGRRSACLQIEGQSRPQYCVPDMALYFAPVKKARTDFIVEKATELGAASITPVMTMRTMADRVNIARLEGLVREAAEQTERLDLPCVHEPVALTGLIKTWNSKRRLIFADEAGDEAQTPWGGLTGRAPPIAEALASSDSAQFALIIGPEGGFAPEERQLLRAQSFVLPVSLGPRILRADTAVVAALSVWQSVLGDWN